MEKTLDNRNESTSSRIGKGALIGSVTGCLIAGGLTALLLPWGAPIATIGGAPFVAAMAGGELGAVAGAFYNGMQAVKESSA